MPPGLALFAASPRALERAKTIETRGYYFDFVEFEKNATEFMTPSTPTISHIYALQSKLDDIFTEGVENRYARHAATNDLVHAWVRKNGFNFFAPEGFRSKSLTCVANDGKIDVAEFLKRLKERHGILIDGGYGKLKGLTFRVSNMGDETIESMTAVVAALDDSLNP
jgi:aspartate aminotransferase-like enzyme